MTGDDLNIAVQLSGAGAAEPTVAFIERCARCALAGAHGEVAIRVVSEAESAELNESYLGKQGPTNVLAFPAGDLPGLGEGAAPLGDIAICAQIVAREADAQAKSAEAHWAHMIVHGCLHIRGYDHQTDAEAGAMEACERALLESLGFDDPYAADET